MDYGMKFDCTGLFKGKRSYPDKAGVTQYGVDVAWLGGARFFGVTREQYESLQVEMDKPVHVVGELQENKFGTRYVVSAIEAIAVRRASAPAA